MTEDIFEVYTPRSYLAWSEFLMFIVFVFTLFQAHLLEEFTVQCRSTLMNLSELMQT